MRISKKQNGIASVEAVLLFPIILLLILILIHITKIMMTNIEVINEVRINAWRESINILEKPRLNKPVAKSGETINTRISYTNSAYSTSIIDDMRKAGNKEYNKTNTLTKVLGGQRAGILVATSTTTYKTSSKLNWSFNAEKKYAFVGSSLWTAKTHPIGYDEYLKDTLDSKCIFTKMFPKAGSYVRPKCKAWTPVDFF